MSTLIGIARHAEPRGPVEKLDGVQVSVERGVEGDCRGVVKPGSKAQRQITVMTRQGWECATRELQVPLDWSLRRVNLLVDGIELPRTVGARLRVGDVLLEVTGECEPCSRMDKISPGLRAALTPDWRGGFLTKVISGGQIAIGDTIVTEDNS